MDLTERFKYNGLGLVIIIDLLTPFVASFPVVPSFLVDFNSATYMYVCIVYGQNNDRNANWMNILQKLVRCSRSSLET